MKHFDEPLTIFMDNQIMGAKNLESALLKLKQPNAFPFLEYLFNRILASHLDASERWKDRELGTLFDTIAATRAEFRSSYKTFKVGFGLIMKIRKFMLDAGYKTLEGDGVLEMMNKGMRGRLARDWKYLGMMIK
jgi:origin recognition complex subunit 3